MITKGIRGAITVSKNSQDSIREATLELMTELFRVNKIHEEIISHIIFTMTGDLDAAFPARFVRLDMNYKKTAMMCFNELEVQDALKMCIRVLVVVNCEDDFEPQYVYLKGAQSLRSN